MLISKVPDDDGGKSESCEPSVVNDSEEYQTANELFELMARNQNFNTSGGDTLTPRDLILLYKNIDLGTKLMSNAKDLTRERHNQHVETIVYNDDPDSDGSDISDIYSNEDLQNVILVNKERIDLLTSQSSIENTLCHKYGDLEIRTSVDNAYDKYFLFKDPYIKEQLKSYNLLSNSNEIGGTILPASLLDYVCCKRLEDNYNFYMDNIIRYVKNTIEQLKRISNGDYLTEKAKEKWREVEHADGTSHSNTKVLATSTSIPLSVECKVDGKRSTWDDIVHSAVDVRSLSKILEKKIVVEIPRLITGSYTLLSKCCADNLIISCKKDNKPAEQSNKESRLDVVFKLKRSETGNVVSKISSIMILQSTPVGQGLQDVKQSSPLLPIMYQTVTDDTKNTEENKVKITEINTSNNNKHEQRDNSGDDEEEYEMFNHEENYSDSIDYQPTEHIANTSFSIYNSQDDTSDAISDHIDMNVINAQREASFEVCPADLSLTMQKLAIQSAVPEESLEDMSQTTTTKKRSPTRVRIKSPYENKSYVMEEKKRRKLLEIRERRERKKMAMAENCKITKHKYAKNAVMPQASSSVTKLSITNKSFYNSIYGQSANVDAKQMKINRKGAVKKDFAEEIGLENLGSEEAHESKLSTERNSKKFINRSYYLDDAVTEMMYLNMKQEEDKEKEACSASTSAVSSDLRNNLSLLSHLMAPSDSEFNVNDAQDTSPYDKPTDQMLMPSHMDTKESNQSHSKDVNVSPSKSNIVPLNSPRDLDTSQHDKNDSKKITTTFECRKSIEKIYQLMKKLGSREGSVSPNANKTGGTEGRESSTQGSDSGTSLKHNLTSSVPSTFSFERTNCREISTERIRKTGRPINVIPKVIISSKSQVTDSSKTDANKVRKDRKRASSPNSKTQDNNPLKAISQLLHEFDNVQRNRVKSGTEQKPGKRTEASASVTDGKISPRQIVHKRRSQIEQHNEIMDRYARVPLPKDRKVRSIPGGDVPKVSYQQVTNDERHIDKSGKKKINDILDEAKEARGEAVRGPSKFTSRLNSLAQPKRSYVQAHSEEYQTRYGRNIITDRLQKLAATSPPPPVERISRLTNPRNKPKRNNNEAVSAVSLKLSPQSGLQIDRAVKHRRSRNSSPECKDKVTIGAGPSYKHNVPETPEISKNKMVAVESYVKNHYGSALSAAVNNEFQTPQISRAPLVPNDIDIASFSSSTLPQESAEVGSKLHRIIDSMVKTTSHGLEVLSESPEIMSRSTNSYDFSLDENPSRGGDGISKEFDYTGTTDDEIVLTSNNSDNDYKEEHKYINNEATNGKRYDVQPFKSAVELEKSDLSLHRPLSVGTFTKRLKLKHAALTPKPSIQQLFQLQSGDAGSVLAKASMSQHLLSEGLVDLKAMSALPNSHWNCNFSSIPMQITTVGYAFPEYNKSAGAGSRSPSLSQLLEEISENSMSLCENLVGKSASQCVTSVDELNKNDCCSKDKPFQHVLKQTEVKNSNWIKKGDQCCNQNGVATPLLNLNKESLNCEDKEKPNEPNNKNPENPSSVDYTTSLDILVGLLNEIQKITTCQNNMTKNETGDCKELEMILNKTDVLGSSVQSNDISITSLDKLRCLESNPSLYSCYLSEGDGLDRNVKVNVFPDIHPWCKTNKIISTHKTFYADKEVSVDIIDNECVNRFTDVPSLFFPITMNHSTNITSSILGELCQTSAQSLFSFSDCLSTQSNESSRKSVYPDVISKKIIELPETVSNQSVVCYKSKNHEVIKTTQEKLKEAKTRYCNNNNVNNMEKNVKKPINKCDMNASGFDPMMKMKRDILVTVYSVLVLTVFAALSFPEILYQM